MSYKSIRNSAFEYIAKGKGSVLLTVEQKEMKGNKKVKWSPRKTR